MSITGSIPMVIYFLLRRIYKEKIAASLYKVLLYISIAFYLIPFPLLSNELRYFFRNLIYKKSYLDNMPITIHITTDKTFFRTQEKTYFPIFSNITYILIIVWMFIGIILLAFHLKNYFKTKKKWIQNSVWIRSDFIKIGFLRKKIQIRSVEEQEPSFNMGIISPVIFIQKGYDSDEEDLVYGHESKHIQHFDCILRFLGFIVIAIHWINPLSYLLLRELIKQSEFSVDESIMKKMSRSEKEEYGNLILKNLTPLPINIKEKYVSSLKGTHFITAKERIMRMKNIRNNKTIKKGIVLAASLIAITVNVIPVMAYQEPSVYVTDENLFINSKDEDVEIIFEANTDTSYFPEDEFWNDDADGRIDFSQSDSYFVSDDKKIVIPISEDQTIHNEAARSCQHSWVTGTSREHQKNSSGGCTINIYNSKKCAKCGQLIKTSLQSSHSYPVCPH